MRRAIAAELRHVVERGLRAGIFDTPDPRMAATALGWMKAQDALPHLRGWYGEKKPTLSPVNNACGWAIERITGERVPAPEDILLPQRGWFLVNAD